MDKTFILTQLKYFYAKNMRMPTYGEMCKLLGYRSKGAVRYAVQKLIQEGILEKDQTGKLIPKKLFAIPHLGIIRAGYPSPAYVQQESIDFYDLLLTHLQDTFSLTVHGDSMEGALIGDGDIVVVKKGKEVKVGDIVAACVDGEWTVKYFDNLNGQFCLSPANSAYPVIYPKTSFEIGGVVVNVIRKYY